MKKPVYLISVLAVILTLFSSCDRTDPQVVTNIGKVFVNSEESVMSFNFCTISKNEVKNVTCVGLEGASIEHDKIDITVTENNTDELNNYVYKGWHIKNHMVELSCKEGVELCEVERIVLDIDGQIQKIPFQTPARHVFGDGNVFSDVLQLSVFPNEFPSSFINSDNQCAVYEFTAQEDLEITGIRFRDFLTYSDAWYSVNDVEGQEAAFPIAIKKGESVRISISFHSDCADSMSYVVTNMYFDYTTVVEGQTGYCGAVVVFDPVYPLNPDDMSKFDEMITKLTA